ncbi:helix-turn-helix domain-containing protein [Desulfitobacterium sp. Sab5]|uniref:helix-turn-helix domain-containing protein n=1 Tax=Desulfitobacterium nosdiversum TaxID=3375356 RepID=UPI003CF2D20D
MGNVIDTKDILQKYMDLKGLTPKQLSEETGVKLVRIKRYLTGDCDKMPMSEIRAFCDYFGLTMDYFLGLSNTKAWAFSIGNEKFESTNASFEKSCVEVVEYLKSKDLLKVEEVKYE